MRISLIIIIFFSLVSCKKHERKKLQNGDIIFQTSLSSQSKAIKLATNSKYSHCGIIFIEEGKTYVFEAVQPVKKTPLDKWIARGKDGHYVVKRLKDDSVLTSDNLTKMINEGKVMAGKNYDLYFEWDNDRIYCSELIWKIYKQGTGLEIGKLQSLKEFDLSNPAVKQKLHERYGNNIPKNEKVISPVAIFNSDLLYTVDSN